MNKYLTEFIGTFFLVLTIGLSVLAPPGAGVIPPIAIGCSLMIMVYMGGHVSGAHYNPAVSLAVLIRGRVTPKDFLIYIIAQIIGALAAAAVTYFVIGKPLIVPPADIGDHYLKAVVIEFLYTFALALVVLNVATSKKTEGNSFYGLAIGFTILVAAFAGGRISGGAYNPAVGLGPALFDAMNGGSSIKHVWVYLVGPLAGGAVAAAVFRVQNPADHP